MRHATRSEVDAAVAAGEYPGVEPVVVQDLWRGRWRSACAENGPALWAACVLFDAHGPAGWSGWVPYPERPGCWQSTTCLAPRLRGRGLLPELRCDQVHRADHLARRWGLVRPEFVSSIDVANERSLKASRRYADVNGWTDWSLVAETAHRRHAWVLEWPNPPSAHPCYLSGT